MTTGFERGFYADVQKAVKSLGKIADNLGRVATALETIVARTPDPNEVVEVSVDPEAFTHG